jgi:hypothetical protein
MKRSASLSWLVSRDVEWLPWWQELILNWVASWGSLASLTVVSADRELYVSWDLPTDLDMQRAELEALLESR